MTAKETHTSFGVWQPRYMRENMTANIKKKAQNPSGGFLQIYGDSAEKCGDALGVSAWEGISGGSRKRGRDRMEIRIQNPWPRNPEGNFEALNQKSGSEIGKSQRISKAFVGTPIHPADDSHYENFLCKIGDSLEEYVTCRGSVLC